MSGWLVVKVPKSRLEHFVFPSLESEGLVGQQGADDPADLAQVWLLDDLLLWRDVMEWPTACPTPWAGQAGGPGGA